MKRIEIIVLFVINVLNVIEDLSFYIFIYINYFKEKKMFFLKWEVKKKLLSHRTKVGKVRVHRKLG